MSTVITGLSHRGYGLLKSHPDFNIDKVKRDLTVKPLSHPDFPDAKAFPMYEDTPTYLLIPRHYGIQKFGEPQVNSLRRSPATGLHFEGQLREAQIEPFETSKAHLKEKKIGVLSLATGSGKTYLALALMCHLKQKTIVLLHKQNLLNQWHDEIRKWIPKAKLQIVQGKRKDWSPEADIHLVMIQTLLNIQTADIPFQFGLVVIDEVHHIAAETFSRVLFKVNSRYMLGLSATPKRADGLTHVLDWHLGGVFYASQMREHQKMEVQIHQFSDLSIPFNVKRYAESITALCNSKTRNEYIMSILLGVITKDPKNYRKMLILTDRVHHVNYLHTALTNLQRSKTCGVITGDTKIKDHPKVFECDIIISTYGMFSEGISLPKLNTIVFATPKKDVTQSVGRILRKVHSDAHALVIDISDSTLRGQERTRTATYNKEVGKGNVVFKYFDKDGKLMKTVGELKEEVLENEAAHAATWSLNRVELTCQTST